MDNFYCIDEKPKSMKEVRRLFNKTKNIMIGSQALSATYIGMDFSKDEGVSITAHVEIDENGELDIKRVE